MWSDPPRVRRASASGPGLTLTLTLTPCDLSRLLFLHSATDVMTPATHKKPLTTHHVPWYYQIKSNTTAALHNDRL